MATRKQPEKKPEKRTQTFRKDGYQPSYPRIAAKLCQMGALDKDLADAFDTSITSIKVWREKHPEFAEACAINKAFADDMVERALFQRAVGYEHSAVKIMQFQGKELIVPYVEHYPPDTTACIFWLKNRRRKEWRDRHEVEMTDNTPTGELLRKARERRKRMEQGESDAS